jgi:hypothetical protein
MAHLHEIAAANIRAELARRQMAHQDAADTLGMPRTAVTNRLSGHVSITLEELENFGLLFDMDPRQLLVDHVGPAAPANGES